MKILFSFFLVIFCSRCIKAQAHLRGWHLGDFPRTGFYGISLDKAYQLIREEQLKSTPVIVAILDDGIDTLHEDLRPVLWVNKKEIPRNGKDDDGNGYADDLFGWNFLGNADGRNVASNSSEWIRVYWRYRSRYEGRNLDTSRLSKAEKYEYALWQKAKSGVVGKGMKETDLQRLRIYLQNAVFSDSILRSHFAGQEYTQRQLEAFKPVGTMEKETRKFFLEVFNQFNTPDITNSLALDELQTYVLGQERIASGDKVPPEDNRRLITGDDDTNSGTNSYGNGDVSNGALMHGTHLAGIIGADRKNGVGMQGIADDVQVMMVRTSAEGDEYDKDIANGIRYAVDNGAKLINMSFGKSLSPDKKMIDDAVKYALSKDVLLVQAAGNSKRNIDGFDNFPNPQFFLTDSLAPNWITVAASDTLGRPAAFTNYGPKLVDVFAPGVAIYSTIPRQNKYMSWDGTSMAAPVVTGIAALLRSYFPNLSADVIKKILLESAVIPAPTSPATTGKDDLKKISRTGGIVNAYTAVKLALQHTRRQPADSR
jgi:subtilisin family serine protease